MRLRQINRIVEGTHLPHCQSMCRTPLSTPTGKDSFDKRVPCTLALLTHYAERRNRLVTGLITSVEEVRVVVTPRTTWKFVRIRTDDGLVGYGESSGSERPGIERVGHRSGVRLRRRSVQDALGAVERRTAEAALRSGAPEHKWKVLSWYAGIEVALCDLAAQQSALPLYRWLGGSVTGRRMPAYANINRAIQHRTPDEFCRHAMSAVDAGFRAIKCAPFDGLDYCDDRGRYGVSLAAGVRNVIGDDIDLMIDGHCILNPEEVATIAPALAELRPRWLEDMAPLADLRTLETLKLATNASLAGGELVADPAELMPALRAGVLDVVMPDVKFAGGLRRAQAIADATHSFAAETSVHNASGPIATAASVHLGYAIRRAGPAEYAYGEAGWRSRIVEPAEYIEDGEFSVPPAHGLGVALHHDLPGVIDHYTQTSLS